MSSRKGYPLKPWSFGKLYVGGCMSPNYTRPQTNMWAGFSLFYSFFLGIKWTRKKKETNMATSIIIVQVLICFCLTSWAPPHLNVMPPWLPLRMYFVHSLRRIGFTAFHAMIFLSMYYEFLEKERKSLTRPFLAIYVFQMHI